MNTDENYYHIAYQSNNGVVWIDRKSFDANSHDEANTYGEKYLEDDRHDSTAYSVVPYYVAEAIKTNPTPKNLSQEYLQTVIANKAGVNVLNCASCGSVFYAERKASQIDCPHCGFNDASDQFSDLFYDGWDDFDLNDEKRRLIADLATDLNPEAYQFNVEEINAIQTKNDLRIYNEAQKELK